MTTTTRVTHSALPVGGMGGYSRGNQVINELLATLNAANPNTGRYSAKRNTQGRDTLDSLYHFIFTNATTGLNRLNLPQLGTLLEQMDRFGESMRDPRFFGKNEAFGIHFNKLRDEVTKRMAQLLQALPWYKAIERYSNAKPDKKNAEVLATLAALASRPAFNDYLGRTAPLPTDVARRFTGLPAKPEDMSWGNHINNLGNQILNMMDSQDRQSGQAGTTRQDVDELASKLVQIIHALGLVTKPQR